MEDSDINHPIPEPANVNSTYSLAISSSSDLTLEVEKVISPTVRQPIQKIPRVPSPKFDRFQPDGNVFSDNYLSRNESLSISFEPRIPPKFDYEFRPTYRPVFLRSLGSSRINNSLSVSDSAFPSSKRVSFLADSDSEDWLDSTNPGSPSPSEHKLNRRNLKANASKVSNNRPSSLNALNSDIFGPSASLFHRRHSSFSNEEQSKPAYSKVQLDSDRFTSIASVPIKKQSPLQASKISTARQPPLATFNEDQFPSISTDYTSILNPFSPFKPKKSRRHYSSSSNGSSGSSGSFSRKALAGVQGKPLSPADKLLNRNSLTLSSSIKGFKGHEAQDDYSEFESAKAPTTVIKRPRPNDNDVAINRVRKKRSDSDLNSSSSEARNNKSDNDDHKRVNVKINDAQTSSSKVENQHNSEPEANANPIIGTRSVSTGSTISSVTDIVGSKANSNVTKIQTTDQSTLTDDEFFDLPDIPRYDPDKDPGDKASPETIAELEKMIKEDHYTAMALVVDLVSIKNTFEKIAGLIIERQENYNKLQDQEPEANENTGSTKLNEATESGESDVKPSNIEKAWKMFGQVRDSTKVRVIEEFSGPKTEVNFRNQNSVHMPNLESQAFNQNALSTSNPENAPSTLRASIKTRPKNWITAFMDFMGHPITFQFSFAFFLWQITRLYYYCKYSRTPRYLV